MPGWDIEKGPGIFLTTVEGGDVRLLVPLEGGAGAVQPSMRVPQTIEPGIIIVAVRRQWICIPSSPCVQPIVRWRPHVAALRSQVGAEGFGAPRWRAARPGSLPVSAVTEGCVNLRAARRD